MAPFGKRSRHRYQHHHRNKKLSPPVIIAICVASALVVSIVAGNLLKVFLDNDAYKRLVDPGEEPANVVTPITIDTPDLNAYYFPFGASTDEIQSGVVSVNINVPDGKLSYTSPVSKLLGITNVETYDFAENMAAINDRTNYLTGVLFSQTLAQPTNDLKYATELRERALIAEFLQGGGNEVLLCNVDLLQAADYVKAIKADLPSAVIGISVPLVNAEENDAHIATLLKTCDFCALDLRGISVENEEEAYNVIKSASFYLIAYDMRLLLSTDQTLFISQLTELSIPDFQIVGA